MHKILFFLTLMLFLFLVPAFARGDPVGVNKLLEQMEVQNELLADLVQLYEAGYDSGKTDLASFLEHQKVKKYLLDSSKVSENSGAMLTKMDMLKESVDSFGIKLDGLEARVGTAEKINEAQQGVINRNTQDIARIFAGLCTVAGFLALVAWKSHRVSSSNNGGN